MPDNRYEVYWIPEATVEAVCRKRGMSDGDGSSFWDWVEIDEFEQRANFDDFGAAADKARSVASTDVFRMPRITRQVYVQDRDDLGNTYRSQHWEDAEVWDCEEGEPIDEGKPTYTNRSD